MNPQRRYSALDRLLLGVDATLRNKTPVDDPTGRPNPGSTQDRPFLTPRERRHAAGLMRVNHAGEVAAQALYMGQATSAHSDATREHMLTAAGEEQDHLRWCQERLQELGSRPSRLSPLWYAGAWTIGSLAGSIGDRASLGFVAETERQVSEHLQGHLGRLPERDVRSREIIRTMQNDEERHGAAALDAGGRRLPGPIRAIMRASAKVMTKTAYWL